MCSSDLGLDQRQGDGGSKGFRISPFQARGSRSRGHPVPDRHRHFCDCHTYPAENALVGEYRDIGGWVGVFCDGGDITYIISGQISPFTILLATYSVIISGQKSDNGRAL